MSFAEFREAVVQGHVETVDISGLEISGTFDEAWSRETKTPVAFETVGPIDDDFEKVMRREGVEYRMLGDDR